MPTRAPILPRLARLARKRSPRSVAETIRRAGTRELAGRRIELGLARASRSQRPVLVGPFLGEVGFELLYWIPMLRRQLELHRIAPERVTVLTRGGAGRWYADLAEHEIDILDLVSREEFSSLLTERRARAGDAKQLTIEPLDRELISRALERTGPAVVVHPILMFTRLRWVWQGVQAVSEILHYGDYRLLPQPREDLPETLAADLPDEYIALKPYFSDCFPATTENRESLRSLVRSLTDVAPVLVLTNGFEIDDHEDWRPVSADRLVEVGPRVEARNNLAVQSTLVAGARALVSTYGGFSYLGPFLGVPTLGFHSSPTFNTNHLDVLRTGLPEADYTVADVRESDVVETFVRRCTHAIGVVPQRSQAL